MSNGVEDGRRYQVGYGKPPRETQFRPGQSGNPSGRPKGAKSLQEAIASLGAEELRLKDGGMERSVSKVDAVALAMLAKAIKGDVRAAQLVAQATAAAEAAATTVPAFNMSGADLDAIRGHADWLALIERAESDIIDDTPR